MWPARSSAPCPRPKARAPRAAAGWRGAKMTMLADGSPKPRRTGPGAQPAFVNYHESTLKLVWYFRRCYQRLVKDHCGSGIWTGDCMMMNKFLVATAALAFSASMVSAATVTIESWSTGTGSLPTAIERGEAIAMRDAFFPRVTATEDFSGFDACPAAGCGAGSTGTPLMTAVGDFSPDGTRRTGTAQAAPLDSVVVRTDGLGNTGGRFAMEGDNWLDSNDFDGVLWTIPSTRGFSFSRLAFFLTDVNDSGNTDFQILLGGNEIGSIGGGLSNAALHLVMIDFGSLVGPDSSVQLRLSNTTSSADGFGIDGIVAGIPLPAPALLLLSGMGVFGGVSALRRRREKAAA